MPLKLYEGQELGRIKEIFETERIVHVLVHKNEHDLISFTRAAIGF